MQEASAAVAELLHPEGVVLIGGLDRSRTAEELRQENEPRFGSPWYLVHPAGGDIDGVPVYASVTELPTAPSLAVLRVPARAVAGVLEECGTRGVRSALVFASGFSETGPAGKALEDEVAAVAQRHGIRLMGPNTNTNAFEPPPPVPGRYGGAVAVVTQSGFQGRPVRNGTRLNLRVSRDIALGNEADLGIGEFLEHLADDPGTDVVAAYIEGFRRGDQVRRGLQRCNEAGVPVVVLKVGRTEAGARMARAHTGHDTGNDTVVDGLFDQYGVTRVDDLDELLETATLFAKLPRTTGPGLALTSVSGGTCTHMAELAELHGALVPELAPATQEILRELIPGFLTIRNPVDNGGAFVMREAPEKRQRALQAIASDPAVDLIVVGFPGASALTTDPMAADLAAAAPTLGVPVVAVWTDPTTDEPGYRDLVEAGLPIFRSFRGCFTALAAHRRYQAHLASRRPRPSLARPEVLAPLAGAEPAEVLAAFGIAVAPPPTDEAPAPTEDGPGGRPPTHVAVEVQRDPVLGLAVVVRTAGAVGELLDDAAARPLPLDRGDAEDLVRSLASLPWIGERAGPPTAGQDAVASLVVDVASLAESLGDDLVSLCLDPVVVRPGGAWVGGAELVR